MKKNTAETIASKTKTRFKINFAFLFANDFKTARSAQATISINVIIPPIDNASPLSLEPKNAWKPLNDVVVFDNFVVYVKTGVNNKNIAATAKTNSNKGNNFLITFFLLLNLFTKSLYN